MAGADPGFLEGGFRCVEERVHFADFTIFLKYPMKSLSEFKLFHFHEIFKDWGTGWGFEGTP